MTCATCKFYQGNHFGNCRRYPESVMKQHSAWCGEYLPIAEAPKEIMPKERKKRELATAA